MSTPTPNIPAGRTVLGPIARLTQRNRHAWAASPWLFIVAFALALAVFHFAGLPRTASVPRGIELELPGTADGALAVLRVYHDQGLIAAARRAIGWDVLLILAYSVGLASLLEWIGRRGESRDELVGYAAWGAFVAGAFDLIEDASMLVMLSQPVDGGDTTRLGTAAIIGTLASLTKWTLLTAVIGYTAWELAKRAAHRFHTSSDLGVRRSHD